NLETTDRSQRSFPTAAGWFFTRSRTPLSCPHAEEPRLKRVHARLACASTAFTRVFHAAQRMPSSRLIAEPLAVFLSDDVKQRTSTRSRDTSASGLCLYLRTHRAEGWAERRSAAHTSSRRLRLPQATSKA